MHSFKPSPSASPQGTPSVRQSRSSAHGRLIQRQNRWSGLAKKQTKPCGQSTPLSQGARRSTHVLPSHANPATQSLESSQPGSIRRHRWMVWSQAYAGSRQSSSFSQAPPPVTKQRETSPHPVERQTSPTGHGVSESQSKSRLGHAGQSVLVSHQDVPPSGLPPSPPPSGGMLASPTPASSTEPLSGSRAASRPASHGIVGAAVSPQPATAAAASRT